MLACFQTRPAVNFSTTTVSPLRLFFAVAVIFRTCGYFSAAAVIFRTCGYFSHLRLFFAAAVIFRTCGYFSHLPLFFAPAVIFRSCGEIIFFAAAVIIRGCGYFTCFSQCDLHIRIAGMACPPPPITFHPPPPHSPRLGAHRRSPSPRGCPIRGPLKSPQQKPAGKVLRYCGQVKSCYLFVIADK